MKMILELQELFGQEKNRGRELPESENFLGVFVLKITTWLLTQYEL